MDNNIAQIIVMVIFMIPLYGILIWTYLEPDESLLLGKRWMYKEDPEPSHQAIAYTRFISMTTMVGLPIVFISLLLDVGILKLIPVVFFAILIIGGMKILSSDDNDE
ncbi:hypothetical protein [Ornithinibacillus scapharcae]|uniref:hypothetical protein n=1 Tax=Ornithinibacillus scapharcae TaxID=1147159 RepID=UPI000225BACB|nr:hypothetical protein [Ornithinibacillus scapharcae]